MSRGLIININHSLLSLYPIFFFQQVVYLTDRICLPMKIIIIIEVNLSSIVLCSIIIAYLYIFIIFFNNACTNIYLAFFITSIHSVPKRFLSHFLNITLSLSHTYMIPPIQPHTGSLKFSCNGHDRVEPPPIVTPTSSTASPHIPKYLELLYDENEDVISPISIISDGYEIPIPDSQLSSAFAVIQNFNNADCSVDHPTATPFEKERTFSSSSTVSEHSICPPPSSNCTNSNRNSNLEISRNQILKVALPNSKEDCSSNETLLLQMQSQLPAAVCKSRPFYTNTKVEEVLNCDGKTMM